MASLHTQKKRALGTAGGQMLGLVVLGFTSIYREGFETVLFLQALVLESGVRAVGLGVAAGLAGMASITVLIFGLQMRLPYKKMLIATGILIGVVLLTMVGNMAHNLQVVGWLPLHPVSGLEPPYWMGLWLGFYPSWEGIVLQAAAALFTIGSYFWAEHMQKRPARLAAHQVHALRAGTAVARPLATADHLRGD
jgi:high-affinity iron transporter